MNRKAIQVAIWDDQTTVLCDDGTIWEYRYQSGAYRDGEWIKLPPIPQDEDQD